MFPLQRLIHQPKLQPIQHYQVPTIFEAALPGPENRGVNKVSSGAVNETDMQTSNRSGGTNQLCWFFMEKMEGQGSALDWDGSVRTLGR